MFFNFVRRYIRRIRLDVCKNRSGSGKADAICRDIIKKEGINVTVRREFGSKISAACGQLRSKKEEE